MSEKHRIVCDNCKTEVEAEYNGEHWISPGLWATLVDNNFSTESFGQHLCPGCVNNLGKEKEKNG